VADLRFLRRIYFSKVLVGFLIHRILSMDFIKSGGGVFVPFLSTASSDKQWRTHKVSLSFLELCYLFAICLIAVPVGTTLVAWHSGRTSVSGRRTFPVLRSTCS